MQAIVLRVLINNCIFKGHYWQLYWWVSIMTTITRKTDGHSHDHYWQDDWWALSWPLLAGWFMVTIMTTISRMTDESLSENDHYLKDHWWVTIRKWPLQAGWLVGHYQKVFCKFNINSYKCQHSTSFPQTLIHFTFISISYNWTWLK